MHVVADVQAPRRKPAVSGPIRPPRKIRPDKRVFLEAEMWEQLSDTAKFHEEAYAELDNGESVSRNDIIETWLAWAEVEFWKALGGRPASKADRAAKVKLYAEKLKAEAAKAEASVTGNTPKT